MLGPDEDEDEHDNEDERDADRDESDGTGSEDDSGGSGDLDDLEGLDDVSGSFDSTRRRGPGRSKKWREEDAPQSVAPPPPVRRTEPSPASEPALKAGAARISSASVESVVQQRQRGPNKPKPVAPVLPVVRPTMGLQAFEAMLVEHLEGMAMANRGEHAYRLLSDASSELDAVMHRAFKAVVVKIDRYYDEQNRIEEGEYRDRVRKEDAAYKEKLRSEAAALEKTG